MADITWHYIENQIANSTAHSFKRARAIGIHHRDAVENAPLSVKAAILTNLAGTLPQFTDGYQIWKTRAGECKGATVALVARIDALRSGIEGIDSSFRVAFPKGSPEHAAAFPLGREPFQAGTQDSRIAATQTLKAVCEGHLAALTLALDTAVGNGEPQAVIDKLTLRKLSMAAAHAEALEFWSSLNALTSLQTDKATEADLARIALEPLREALCDAMYGNLGLLMSVLKTAALRPQIATFFDLSLLRQTEPEEEEPEVIPPVPPPPPTP